MTHTDINENEDTPFHISEKEEVKYRVGRHWFAILPATLASIMLAVIPGIVLVSINAVEGVSMAGGYLAVIIAGYALWLLMVSSFYFVAFTDYILDAWYITNQRVIDVDQTGLFNRRVASLSYENVEDVTIDVSGVIATFLSFGTLNAQSAGTSREFELYTAHDPKEAKRVVRKLKNASNTNSA